MTSRKKTTIQFFQSRHSSDMAPSIERQPIDYLQQNKTVYKYTPVNIIPKVVVGVIWDQKLDRRKEKTMKTGFS